MAKGRDGNHSWQWKQWHWLAPRAVAADHANPVDVVSWDVEKVV